MAGEIVILLMRHGRSRADDEGVHEGRYDSPLTETGRRQVAARAAGWQAAGLQPQMIIASPLQRAHEAASMLGKALGAPVETDPLWMEMDGGPLAGLPYAVAQNLYPTPAFRNPYEPFHGTGESDWEVHCRAVAAIQGVIRRGPGTYLVVSHGGILNAVLRGILGIQPPVNNRHGVFFAFGDTGYVRVIYHPDQHRWVLTELHATPAVS